MKKWLMKLLNGIEMCNLNKFHSIHFAQFSRYFWLWILWMCVCKDCLCLCAPFLPNNCACNILNSKRQNSHIYMGGLKKRGTLLLKWHIEQNINVSRMKWMERVTKKTCRHYFCHSYVFICYFLSSVILADYYILIFCQ